MNMADQVINGGVSVEEFNYQDNEIEQIQRMIAENRMTMSPEELRNQEMIMREIEAQKRVKVDQLVRDEEIARGMNFKEIVRA